MSSFCAIYFFLFCSLQLVKVRQNVLESSLLKQKRGLCNILFLLFFFFRSFIVWLAAIIAQVFGSQGQFSLTLAHFTHFFKAKSLASAVVLNHLCFVGTPCVGGDDGGPRSW
uniref:Secreted protein n=1 Tax=Ixodes ricinus TaxID=34613 RepID=A0A6B0UK31_IXORI